MKVETLKQFKEQVEDELMRRLGIGINDCASDENIEQALQALQLTSGFKYSINGNEIEIY